MVAEPGGAVTRGKAELRFATRVIDIENVGDFYVLAGQSAT
jgi:hypothetical protein